MKHDIQRQADRIDYDRVAFNKRFRFCPCCGCANLERHDRKLDVTGKPIQGAEFWCVLCGFSFNARTSTEWNIALALFKEHRQMRGGVQFKESKIDTSVMKAWKEKYERPIFPAVSSWNLGDKIKAALGIVDKVLDTSYVAE